MRIVFKTDCGIYAVQKRLLMWATRKERDTTVCFITGTLAIRIKVTTNAHHPPLLKRLRNVYQSRICATII